MLKKKRVLSHSEIKDNRFELSCSNWTHHQEWR